MSVRLTIVFILLAVGCASPHQGPKHIHLAVAPEHEPTITVYLAGEVDRPQKYSLSSPVHLSTALSAAGGATIWAGDRISIIRHAPNGSQTKYRYSLYRLRESSSDSKVDPLLEDGDVVNVGRQL